MVRVSHGPRASASAEPGSAPRSGPASAPSPASTRTLHVWNRALGLSAALDTRPVRRFAGWCAAGDHLAYVVPDPRRGADRPLWSFLLVPDPLARDAVVIADGAGDGGRAGKTVFSGLRVTFPHWSPSSSDDVLSLWCTFSPSHRSVVARFLGGGLRSGDPAAPRCADRHTLVDGRQPARRSTDRPLSPDQARLHPGMAAVRARGGRRTGGRRHIRRKTRAEDRCRVGEPAVLAARNRGIPVPMPAEARPASRGTRPSRPVSSRLSAFASLGPAASRGDEAQTTPGCRSISPGFANFCALMGSATSSSRTSTSLRSC